MRVLAISLFLAGALGQDQTERPVFRSGVSLVRLDVRIVDDAGRPIPDIRPEEAEVATPPGAGSWHWLARQAGRAAASSTLLTAATNLPHSFCSARNCNRPAAVSV